MSDDNMDDILGEYKKVDKRAYSRAKEQASKLYEYLMAHDECRTLVIDVGEKIFELDVTHMDVLNELYIMLENLCHLGDN